MKSVSALRDMFRILKPDSVFAAIDYVCDWRVEKAFVKLYRLAKNQNRKF